MISVWIWGKSWKKGQRIKSGVLLWFADRGQFCMELILARQSVVIKCNRKASVLMGNYEFYYAAGLLCRLAGHQPAQDLRPQGLMEAVKPLFDTYKPQNEQEDYLMKLLLGYRALDEYDAQMPQLLAMGLEEKNMWGIQ